MFNVGTLVRAREREWVVLPESEDDFLIVRPLGATDAEIAGIDTNFEHVESASFEPPDPNMLGDYQSCKLLRDAIRLGFRSSAGPFRSFGRIAVEPRPYQLVPLIMALKLDPVRMLIADDVGIGKTVESLLIARELLDRGEVNRMTVLCPPHLAEQWQREMKDKFHIDAELVLSSTAKRLDSICGGKSVFEVFKYTIVSLDYIKTPNRRDDFVQQCPELVIIDEAHTCTVSAQKGRGGGRQLRHQVVQKLSTDNPDRHMIFVTATPHSGNEHGFRSLLELVNPEFTELPDDMSGDQHRKQREQLARYFVQRRRADIRPLETEIPFPDRLEKEETYELGRGSEYRNLFETLLKYARETVQDAESLSGVRQRVRWWSALGLLRSLASSPAAAAATLRTRAAAVNAATPEEVDEISRPLVLDEDVDESSDVPDYLAGADVTDLADDDATVKRDRDRLLKMARDADELQGNNDPKLINAVKLVKKMVKDGVRPILFCRFIATAEYVAAQLRERLPKKTTVACVTGTIPAQERENRIAELEDEESCVLVCTDCLSEGINLQHVFNAVVHYDLSWNPTRHEQREGRVDRFGQESKDVFVVTYYGTDNQIDGVVLDVLIRKHNKIRKQLGISIPVPTTSNTVLEALYEGLLLRHKNGAQLTLGFEDDLEKNKDEFHDEWERASEREKKSRSLFAQNTIKFDEVAQIVDDMRKAIGTAEDVKSFTQTAIRGCGGTASETNGVVKFDVSETPRAIKEATREDGNFAARFQPVVARDEVYLSRTHPVVEGLATWVMDSTLDSGGKSKSLAARCGAIRTNAVAKRTSLLLVRFRYHILKKTGDITTPLLAEDCQLVGFTGTPANAEWLSVEDSEALLAALPDENLSDDNARNFLEKALAEFEHLTEPLNETAERRGKELLAAHQQVRKASAKRGVKYDIQTQMPPDILGLYIFLPVIG